MPEILVFFLVGSLLQLVDVLELYVVFDDGLVILILLMDLFLERLVLIHESVVLCSFLLFKYGLFVLHFLHDIFIVEPFFLDFCSHDINLLSCRINFIIRHVDGSKDIGLLGLPECQSRLDLLDSGLAEWCLSIGTSGN